MDAAADKRRLPETGNNRQKFDHTANFETVVDERGVTSGARDKTGRLQYVNSESDEGRALAYREGRADLLPPRKGLPMLAQMALAAVGGVGLVLAVKKVRDRKRKKRGGR